MNLKTSIANSWIVKYRDLVLLAAIAVLVYFVCSKPKSTSAVPSNPLALKQVDTLRDANNKLYAKLEQQTLQQAAIQQYADSLANALKISKKSIKSVDRIVSKDSIVYIDTATQAVYNPRDTSIHQIVAYSTEFKDAWVDIKAVAGKDTGSIKFTSVDTLTRVLVSESHLFKPTTHFIYLGNTNPHNDVTEGASFQIQEKKPWLVLGPSVQYSPIGNHITVGVSAVYPIFTFKR